MNVRIASFNIRNGRAKDGDNDWAHRREFIGDAVRALVCDAIGAQEAFRYQLDDIRAAAPEYGEIGAGRDDGQTAGEYCAILYRADRFDVGESGTFWFSDTPDTPGSAHWGNICMRICTWARVIERATGAAFHLYNLHLDHKSQSAREKSAQLLARRIRDRRHIEEPVVVTGDFNCREENVVIRYLIGEAPLGESVGQASRLSDVSCLQTDDRRDACPTLAAPVYSPAPLIDTFRALHPAATTADATEAAASVAGTYHGFEGKRDGGRIDYILVSPGVRILEAEIVRDQFSGRYPSDHFPITARLVVSEPCKA